MKNVFFALLMVVSAVFISCETEDSADVNQDKIYTVYEIFYNENSDKTVAIARFRFGNPAGTLLELNDPAGVTFEGDVLPYSIVYSGHAKEFAGKITEGTFEYVDVDGNVFENTIPTLSEIDHPQGFTTITKSQANTYAWEGSPLSGNERVNLFVGSWTWGDDALFFASGEGATDIVMGTDQINQLPVGSSTLYVDRVNEVSVTEGTSEGGVIRTRFRPENTQVEVVE